MQAPVEQTLKMLKKEYPDTKYYLNFSSPLELLVATILSAQVRDEVVNAATPHLFRKYKTARDFAGARVSDVENIVKSITFYKNKSKNIIEACKILDSKYGGKVPKTMEELIELPGVGRKTANAILTNVFDIVEGVVVDTHVIRVSYRLGWTNQTNADKIEQDLIKIIPKTDWKRLQWLLKDHGRAVCKAQIPACSRCPLGKMCPKQGVTKKL